MTVSGLAVASPPATGEVQIHTRLPSCGSYSARDSERTRRRWVSSRSSVLEALRCSNGSTGLQLMSRTLPSLRSTFGIQTRIDGDLAGFHAECGSSMTDTGCNSAVLLPAHPLRSSVDCWNRFSQAFAGSLTPASNTATGWPSRQSDSGGPSR